jgi:hypothetical protein
VVGSAKVEMTFYSSAVWELGCPERVAGGGDADSMLRFWLEKGDDGTKRCQKIKWRLRARLVSMKTKRDSVATSAGGVAAPERGKGGDDAS